MACDGDPLDEAAVGHGVDEVARVFGHALHDDFGAEVREVRVHP